MTTTERLVLPLTPEGWPTGYTWAPATLPRVDDDEWLVTATDRITTPAALTQLPARIATKRGFRDMRIAADGQVYANCCANICLRLSCVKFDAGPVVCQEHVVTVIPTEELVSGMVCWYGHDGENWLHILRYAMDGGWNITSLAYAHRQREDHNKYLHYSNMTYASDLIFLHVPVGDAYVLK